jgi:hypothetical protein
VTLQGGTAEGNVDRHPARRPGGGKNAHSDR